MRLEIRLKIFILLPIITITYSTESPAKCFQVHPNQYLERSGTVLLKAVANTNACLQKCLQAGETQGFLCRSVLWVQPQNDCILSRWDRYMRPDRFRFNPNYGIHYYENRCLYGKPERNGERARRIQPAEGSEPHSNAHEDAPITTTSRNKHRTLSHDEPKYSTSDLIRPPERKHSMRKPTTTAPLKLSLLNPPRTTSTFATSSPSPNNLGINIGPSTIGHYSVQRIVQIDSEMPKPSGPTTTTTTTTAKSTTRPQIAFDVYDEIPKIPELDLPPIALSGDTIPKDDKDRIMIGDITSSAHVLSPTINIRRGDRIDELIAFSTPPPQRTTMSLTTLGGDSEFSPLSDNATKKQKGTTLNAEKVVMPMKPINRDPQADTADGRILTATDRCFRKTPDLLPGNKVERFRNVTLARCQAECHWTKGYHCGSITYDREERLCTLHDEQGSKVRRFTNHSPVDLYENVCRTTPTEGILLNGDVTPRKSVIVPLPKLEIEEMEKCFNKNKRIVFLELDGVVISEANSLAACLYQCIHAKKLHQISCRTVNHFQGLSGGCIIYNQIPHSRVIADSVTGDMYENKCYAKDSRTTAITPKGANKTATSSSEDDDYAEYAERDDRT